jgi:ABC-type transport system involved in multi-copper enzyme maturation permease subunit
MIATGQARNPFQRLGDSLMRVGVGIVAVGTKELRGRMRGRRAFAVLTLYLVLLAVFSWGIYEFQRDAATMVANQAFFNGFGVAPVAISAQIGQALFTGLLLVETVLVAVLAPAFTTGAISLERERQTLDLLVTTPLSSLGLVLGKLGSALAYVFLLIFASLPMAAVVFLFGGVGPDDLLRAYVLLVCFAVGFGAIGLFISALVKRTQVATVLTYLTILALTAGTWVIWYFLYATSGVSAPGGFIAGTGATSGRPAQQMLWLNPFVADMDLICVTSVTGSSQACQAMSAVTGKPYFGGSFGISDCPPGTECLRPMPAPLPFPVVGLDDALVQAEVGVADPAVLEKLIAGGVCPPNARCMAPNVALDVAPVQETLTGFPRDTFWPQSAMAFLVVSLVLTLLSARLVMPSRRGARLPGLRRGQKAAP